MLSWHCIFHLAVCTTQGIKALSENKVNGPRSLKLGHPMSFCFSLSYSFSASFSTLFSYLQHSFLISFSIFLHSGMSSILRISLDSAEAGPRHLHTIHFLEESWRLEECWWLFLMTFMANSVPVRTYRAHFGKPTFTNHVKNRSSQ